MSIGIPELVILLVVSLGTLFWIWMLVDCATREKDPQRLIWMIIIFFTHLIGAALYFLVRRLARRAEPLQRSS